jgi:hypothetical protein
LFVLTRQILLNGVGVIAGAQPMAQQRWIKPQRLTLLHRQDAQRETVGRQKRHLAAGKLRG